MLTKRIIISVILLSTGYCAFSMDNQITNNKNEEEISWHTTFDNKELNPETISKIACSEQFKIKDKNLLNWLETHKPLLTTLARYTGDDSDLIDWRPRLIEGNKLLDEHNFDNKGKHNFIFRINVGNKNSNDSRNYMVKISSANRFEQLNEEYNRGYGKALSREEYQTLPYKNTFQSASRFATYLLFKKWQNLSNNKDIPLKAIKTFLYPLSNNNLIDDENVVIVEKYKKNIAEGSDLKDALITIKDSAKDFISHLRLWNINSSQFVVSEKGIVYCVDTESRDRSKPSEFFNKDYKNAEGLIGNGLNGLHQMLQEQENK